MAGWSSEWPLHETTPFSVLTDYNVIGQLWWAMYERGWMFTNAIHPWLEYGHIWWAGGGTDGDGGVIGALVNNGDGSWTLTDNDLNPLPGGGTDDGRFWNGIERTGCGTHPPYWVGLDCPNSPFLDGMYDVILEYNEGDGGDPGQEWWRTIKPWYSIRGNIVANTNDTLSFTAKPENWVVAKCIPATADLVGKRYYILRTGGQWPFDINPNFGRMIDWPNDEELWRGVVDEGKFYSDNTGYLREDKNKVLKNPYFSSVLSSNGWKIDAWKDLHTLAYDTAGNEKRLTPTSNIGNVIFFGGRTSIPTPEEEADLTVSYTFAGDFTVVPVDFKGFPGRDPWPLFNFNAGYKKGYYGHQPDYDGSGAPDNNLHIYPAIIAGDTYTYNAVASALLIGLCSVNEPAPTGSLVEITNTLDNDIRTPFDNYCDPADYFAAPQIHKTLRQLQVDIIAMIGQCVRAVSYIGEKEIPNYAVARCFYDCAINAGTTMVSKDSVTAGGVTTTRYYFVATGDVYKSQFLYYEVVQSGIRRTAWNEGQSADVNGRINVHTTTASDVTADDAAWLGATVYWSAGFDRYVPLLWSYFYDVWVFIIDVDVDEEGNTSPIYPPQVLDFEHFGCFGVGSSTSGSGGWVKRLKSATGKYYDDRGEAHDGDGRDPVEGEVYLLDGDNWHDPGTGISVRNGEDATDLPYQDRRFYGKHKRNIHPRMLADLSGTITAGTKYSFTDDTKHWWRDWFDGGEMISHEFTADDGSTTTFQTDDTWGDDRAYPDGNENSCWFGAGRFNGWTSPFKDFILEVDKTEHNATSDEDETVTYKLPITSAVHSTHKWILHFAAVDQKYGGGTMTVANGDAGRIREPNTKAVRFIGRRAEIRRADGTTFDVEIQLSDDNTAFVEAQEEAFQDGWTYHIVDYYPGGCWMFTTTEPTDEEKASSLKWQKIGENKFFVQPVGEDPRGEHPDWHETMTENEPHYRKQFGLMRKRDQISYKTLNQMRDVIRRLKWIQKGSDWTASDPNSMFWQVSGVAGASYGPATSGFTPPNDNYGTAWAAWAADVESGWPYFPLAGPVAGPPLATLINDVIMTATGPPVRGVGYISNNTQVQRRFAFPIANGCPIRMWSSVVFMAYAQIDLANHDEGVVKNWLVQGGTGDAQANYEENHFDPQNTPLLFREWAEVGTLPADISATRTGATQVGDAENDAPVWTQPPDPVAHQDDANATSGNNPSGATSIINSGFYVSNQLAILKFDVAGGLEYT